MKINKKPPVYQPLGKGYIDVELIAENEEDAKQIKDNPDDLLFGLVESPLRAEKVLLTKNQFRVYFANPKGLG